MDYNILTYLACICFLFLFGRIFIVPIKKVLKLVVNSILGGAIIYIINLRCSSTCNIKTFNRIDIGTGILS